METISSSQFLHLNVWERRRRWWASQDSENFLSTKANEMVLRRRNGSRFLSVNKSATTFGCQDQGYRPPVSTSLTGEPSLRNGQTRMTGLTRKGQRPFQWWVCFIFSASCNSTTTVPPCPCMPRSRWRWQGDEAWPTNYNVKTVLLDSRCHILDFWETPECMCIAHTGGFYPLYAWPANANILFFF